MNKRPVYEVKLGLIKAQVWEVETKAGLRHNVTVVRLYKNGDKWVESRHFGRDDLLALAKVVDMAHGNPLFTEELVRMFIDQGVLQSRDGTWRLVAPVTELSVPGSVHAEPRHLRRCATRGPRAGPGPTGRSRCSRAGRSSSAGRVARRQPPRQACSTTCRRPSCRAATAASVKRM